MDPITLAVAGSFVLGSANSLIQTNAQIKDLKAQAELKLKESAVLFENAAIQANANSYNEDLIRQENAHNIAQMRVSSNESGIEGGTLYEYNLETEVNAEADILMQRYNMSTQYHAMMYEAQKAQDTAMALKKNASRMKKTGWLSALLSGASSATSMYGAVK